MGEAQEAQEKSRSTSEQEFHPDLDVTRQIPLACDPAEVRIRRIDVDAVKPGAIKSVQEIGAELISHVLADFELLHCIDVPVVLSRVAEMRQNSGKEVLMIGREFD